MSSFTQTSENKSGLQGSRRPEIKIYSAINKRTKASLKTIRSKLKRVQFTQLGNILRRIIGPRYYLQPS